MFCQSRRRVFLTKINSPSIGLDMKKKNHFVCLQGQKNLIIILVRKKNGVLKNFKKIELGL